MDYWSSDKLDVNTLKCLLADGLVKINDDILTNYLNYFGSNEVIDNFDEYLLNLMMGKFNSRR